MADKYITEYLEETTPATTDAVLIDKGSGVYKYCTLLNLNAGSATTLETTRTIWGQNFNGSANVTGALSGATTITASGKIETTNTAVDSIKTAGGGEFAGKLQVEDTTDATSTTDGAQAIAGGLSVAKNVVAGGDIYTTEWTAWTPTVGVNGSDTAPTYQIKTGAYKQVGKTIHYSIVLDNNTGGTAGSGNTDRIIISLPSGKGWGSTTYSGYSDVCIGLGTSQNGGTEKAVYARPIDANNLSLYQISGGRFYPDFQNNVDRGMVIQGFYEID